MNMLLVGFFFLVVFADECWLDDTGCLPPTDWCEKNYGDNSYPSHVEGYCHCNDGYVTYLNKCIHRSQFCQSVVPGTHWDWDLNDCVCSNNHIWKYDTYEQKYYCPVKDDDVSSSSFVTNVSSSTYVEDKVADVFLVLILFLVMIFI